MRTSARRGGRPALGFPLLAVLALGLLWAQAASARGQAAAKCGTPHVLDAMRRLGPAAFAKRAQTPKQYQYDSPGGFFRIQYDMEGRDAVSREDSDQDEVPDYVEAAAEAFDRALQLEVLELGYRSPFVGEERGDERYEVFIRDLGVPGYYGLTHPQIGPDHAFTSFIEVDNDFLDPIYPTRGLDGLRVTAAHEFFHAIHFAYYLNTRLDALWWMEITATWMEDVAWDSINDYYHYVRPRRVSPSSFSDAFFDMPGAPLDHTNGYYEYGASVFGHFLAALHGRDIIRACWEAIGEAQRGDVTVIDGVLPGGLAAAVPEFAVWNYFTGPRARPSQFYPEGSAYAEVWIPPDRIHHAYPVSGSGTVDHLGSHHTRFIAPDEPATLVLDLELDPRTSWRVQVVRITEDRPTIVPLDPSMPFRLTTGPFDEEIVLISTTVNLRGHDFTYVYSAHLGLTPVDIGEPTVFVWPGDTNNDGVVGVRDVLPIGIFWGAEGPPRADGDISWSAKGIRPWEEGQAAFADANGDGRVDARDVEAVRANWSRVRPGEGDAAVAKLAPNAQRAAGSPLER